MKFLVIGDLHGQKPTVPDIEFDAIIVPGDVCADDGIKELMHEAVNRLSEGEEYVDWWDVVGLQKAQELLDYSLDTGHEILSYLDSFGVPVYAIPGNWDWTEYDDASWDVLHENLWETRVCAGHENVIDCDFAVVELEGLSLIGYGRVNGPEKRDLRGYKNISDEEVEESHEHYEELLELYSMMFDEADSPVIFLAHNVPYGTSLDVIENPDSALDGMHYGSNLVRALIEKYHPLISIGGHMHEHYGTDAIGNTVCLNAGFGSDKLTLVEVVDGNVSVRKL